MRVVSGSARGCKLQPVPCMSTRPTTDRVKENVFNLIQEHVRGAEVLDLFAGTGQLGIEALSRGARHCDFVECDKAAYNIVCKNTETARVADRALATPERGGRLCFLCWKAALQLDFLDPPYGGEILENALLQIETFDILSTNGIIICESAVEDRFAHGFEVVRERRYGATLITVLRNGETDEKHESSDLSGADPVTLGHLDIIRRASVVFDRLIVAVMHNQNKKPMFSVDERMDFLKRTTGDLPNVEVASFGGLLADYAKQEGACAVVKGLRAVSDFEYEFQMALANRKLNPELDTVFLMTSAEYMYLSSSVVKDIAVHGAALPDLSLQKS